MATNGRELSVGERIIASLQEFTQALESGADLSKKFRVHRLRRDLIPKSYGPAKVRKTRKLLATTPSMFALLLGVSAQTVRSWERGARTPSTIACRFMDEISRNPAYWIGRLKDAVGAD